MFCTNCGKKSEGHEKFCTQCGKELSHGTSQKSQHTATPSFTKAKFRSSWSVGRVISILFIIAIVGWGIYASQDDAVIEKNNNAISNFDSGNSAGALTQLQEASRDAVSTENKINTLKNLAYVYSGEGKNDLALSTFKEALALTSNGSFDYYLIAGEVALLEGKPNAALLAYNKAYSMEPNNFQINSALALFYLDMEEVAPQYIDYAKAVQYAQRATQLSDLQILKQNLGFAYFFNENYSLAISTFKGLTLDKDTITALWLGFSYAAIDDTANAKIYFRKAIANGVKVPKEVYDYLAEN